jgi:predicted XRE-type DNA-binding protein
MDEEIAITLSSGNVFADLHLPEPEALLANAEPGARIRAAILERGWTQVHAAAVLGIDQPKVSLLMSARVSGFSIERLVQLLLRLDRDLDIVVRPKRDEQARLCVSSQRAPTRSITQTSLLVATGQRR